MSKQDTEVISLEEPIWYCSNDNKRYKGPFNFDGLIRYLSTQTKRDIYIFSIASGNTYSFEEISKLYAQQYKISLSSFLSQNAYKRTGDLLSGIAHRSKSHVDSTAGTKLIMKDSLTSQKREGEEEQKRADILKDLNPDRKTDDFLLDDSRAGEYMVWLLIIMMFVFALMIFGIIEPKEIYKDIRRFLYPYLN